MTEGAYWIRNKKGKVLGVDLTNPDGIVPLVCQVRFPDHKGLTDHSQMWFIEAVTGRSDTCYLIRNAMSELVLHVKERDSVNGITVFVHEHTGDDRQFWKIELLDDASERISSYRLINICTCTALDQATDRHVVLSSLKDGQQQHWFLEPVTLPTVYSIIHAWTGWYLQYDATKREVIAGTMQSLTPTHSQLWTIEEQKNSDIYVIRNVKYPTKILDLFDSFASGGNTPVVAGTYNKEQTQQWHIRKVDPDDHGNDRVKLVSALAHSVIQVDEGSQYGTMQVQTSSNNIWQSWRVRRYASNVSPRNKDIMRKLKGQIETHVQDLSIHVSPKDTKTSVSSNTNKDKTDGDEYKLRRASRHLEPRDSIH
ncbi:hypothetical protein EW145_g4130 [Phellinidium pouzarii]|uniref:Ricin B lectin domain-containing protein n=1 Tax=Phellinidium pouzarii TaxID=167371 RepID=A0A4S4L4X0_9AGAM|nr:hypothetical protein EW145_g4130 [Phellinidium pouzarii]